MKKYLSIALAFFVGVFVFTACSDTVADISTSDGGEIEVTESEDGRVEETVDLAGGPTVTGETNYEHLTITYTAPDGYTETVNGGEMVTFSLDGYEVGEIVYIPEPVGNAVLDGYYTVLGADAEQLREYVAPYAVGLDLDYEVSKQDVGGRQAILVTGTVAEGSAEDNPGDVGYVLLMPMGDQLIVLRGVADETTAATIQKDLLAFAEGLVGTPAESPSSIRF